MKPHIIAVVLGLYFWLGLWLTGIMGFGKAITVGITVFATMMFLDVALDELVKREIENMEQDND